MELPRREAWLVALAGLTLGIVAGLAALSVSGAWSAGFSGADEPAHFLNAYFISLYQRGALGSDPMAFATEFYLHYPKLTIGHWPPAYYALLSPLFLIFPPTTTTAFAINLVVSALPSLVAALILARLHGRWIALAGALLCAVTPVALEGPSFFMLDQALAAAALLATLIWVSYVERPAAWRVLLFALVAAAAVLVKGNGWLLLFVPPIHLALTGRWAILRSPWPWAAAMLAAVLIGPWYWLTAGISADGFNYRPGLDYAARALVFNLGVLFANLTPVGLILAGYGIHAGWRHRRDMPGRWSVLAGCAALALATLLFHSLIPVDMADRYVAPALPPLVVLALSGACAAASRLGGRWVPVAAAAAALIAVPGAVHLWQREPKIDLRMAEAAAYAARAGRPSAWLVDGTTGAEGAFIAELAVRDPRLQSYAIRASSLLARSNWMGRDYAMSVANGAELLARLDELGIQGVVVARIGGKPAFPHSALLKATLAGPGSPYRLVAKLPHRNRSGVSEIYSAATPVTPSAGAIRALGLPAKLGALR